MRTIVFANLKGGVGKTFSAINTAIILSEIHSNKVLIVDNDPQGNTSKFFGVHDFDSKSMEDVLIGTDNPDEVIKTLRENNSLDIIPGNSNIDVACQELIKRDDEEQNTKLGKVLKSVEDRYDYCIIDCQPGMGLNTINALCAANDIIIPVQTDKESIDGLEEIGYFIDDAKSFNPELETVRCLITMFIKDEISVKGKEIVMNSGFDVFNTVIRASTRVAKKWSYETGKSICEFSPRCSAAVDYKNFVIEYLGGK